jgi:hypothetical protein
LADAEAAADVEYEKRIARTVQTAVAVSQARADKVSDPVRKVAEKIVKHVAAGRTKWREVTHALKSCDRQYLHAASTLAVSAGWIVREGATVRLNGAKT